MKKRIEEFAIETVIFLLGTLAGGIEALVARRTDIALILCETRIEPAGLVRVRGLISGTHREVKQLWSAVAAGRPTGQPMSRLGRGMSAHREGALIFGAVA